MGNDRIKDLEGQVVIKPEADVTEGEPVTDDNGVEVEEIKNGREGDVAAREFMVDRRFNV
jgi:hypothetical protein